MHLIVRAYIHAHIHERGAVMMIDRLTFGRKDGGTGQSQMIVFFFFYFAWSFFTLCAFSTCARAREPLLGNDEVVIKRS